MYETRIHGANHRVNPRSLAKNVIRIEEPGQEICPSLWGICIDSFIRNIKFKTVDKMVIKTLKLCEICQAIIQTTKHPFLGEIIRNITHYNSRIEVSIE